jgi:hypothetical protein
MATSKILFTSKPRGPAPPAICALVAERLAEAKANAELAELDYRREALLALQGSTSDEAGAEERLGLARREIARLEAVLIEAKAQEAEAERAAKAAKEAAEDAELVGAFEEWAKTAEALAPILDSYAEAFLAMCYAADRARSLAGMNPRAPRGLDVQNSEDLVATELARVARVQRPLLPGASEWVMAACDRRALKPLAKHFRDLADVLRERMSHD